MSQPAATTLDRRQRRRRESIEEILDVALDVMAEQGVAGLSLGEVARRLGIRPPSLYVYFASKHALYDAEFSRGAEQVYQVMSVESDRVLASAGTLEDALDRIGRTFVGWALDNPVYAQLLFWRPVPGYRPSPEAYEPAVRTMEFSSRAFAAMQERGWLRSDLSADDILRDWAIVLSGVLSQQLANEPDATFAAGRYTAALPNLVSMFAAAYSAPARPTKASRKSTNTGR
jgi:AcrR family transcriptional regulator